MSRQLAFSSEAFSALLARILPTGKMCAQVILQGQLIGVSFAAKRTVILAGFVGLFVVHQTAGVAIRTPALLAGKGSAVARVFRFDGGLWRRSRRRPSGVLGFGLVHLHQGLDLVVELLDLGSVLLVPPEVDQKLLLDFEGFAALGARMPGRER